MSATSKIVPKHVEEQTVQASRTCDICGRVQQYGERERFNIGDWIEDDFEWFETEISITSRHRYDEGDYNTEVVDLCPKCFRERLLPWLASQGARPHNRKHWERM